jgi:hypothetical protein
LHSSQWFVVFGLLLPIIGSMYLDILETKRETKQQQEQVKRLINKMEKRNDPNCCVTAWHISPNGLGLLSSAIQAKGKEVVENTLGVKIPDAPTPEDISKLRQLQFDHEERLLELGIEKAKLELAELDLLAKAAQSDADNVTDR